MNKLETVIHRHWFISLPVMLLVLVLSGTACGGSTSQGNAQNTLDKYCSAITSGDFHTAFQQYSKESGPAKEGETAWTAATKHLSDQDGGFTKCTATNVSENGSTATGMITIMTGKGMTLPQVVTLVLEDGVWKINGGVSGPAS